MKWATAVLTLTVLIASAGCTPAKGRFQPRSHLLRGHPRNVVHFDGVGSVPFGVRLPDVRDKLAEGTPSCNGTPSYGIPGYQGHAELIFDSDDKFVMAWIYSPEMHTPERLTIGSPIEEARTTYPDARERPATQRSYPALLAESGDTALMFLYEPSGGEIVKILAGYSAMLKSSQSSGASC